MMNTIKRFLFPNRIDACFWAVALHWVIAVSVICVMVRLPYRDDSFDSLPSLIAAACTWVAVAVAVCWRPISWTRVTVLLASSLLSLLVVVGWLSLNFDANKVVVFQVQPYGAEDATIILWFVRLALNLVIALALAAAAWLLNRSAMFVALKLKANMQTGFNSIGGDRSRFMIGIAVVLFAVAIISRVASEFVPENGLGGGSVEVALQIPLLIAGWLIALVWFPRSFMLERRPVQKFLSLLISSVVVFAVCIAVLLETRAEAEKIFPSFAGGLILLLSVLSVGKSKFEVEQSSDEKRPRVAKPSLIGYFAIALLIGCAVIPSFLDIGVFTLHQSSFASRFDDAVFSARVYRQTGGQVRAIPSYWSGGSLGIWQADFHEDASPDVLDTLANRRILAIQMQNLSPHIDLKTVANNGGMVSLMNSKICVTQLGQLLSSSGQIHVHGEFEIVDDGGSIPEAAVSYLIFQDCSSGTIQAFVDAIDGEINVASTQVYIPVTNEDWPAIERLSESGKVILYAGLAPGFEIPSSSVSLANVELQLAGNDNGARVPNRKELVLNSDIVIYLRNVLAGKPEMAFKIMMLRDSPVQFDIANWLATAESSTRKSLQQLLTENNLAYEFGNEGEIKSVFLPRCADEQTIMQLTDLRVLSFDESWLVGTQASTSWAFTSTVGPAIVSYLEYLTNLEELYFGEDFVPSDTAFLKQLPKLRHLQVPRIERKVMGPIGFDSCKSLESITFLAKPDAISVRELAKVKTLKRCVIANLEDDDSMDVAYLARLRKVLRGVDVELVPKSKVGTLVPESFKQHREKIRKELKADTAWLDELLAPE